MCFCYFGISSNDFKGIGVKEEVLALEFVGVVYQAVYVVKKRNNPVFGKQLLLFFGQFAVQYKEYSFLVGVVISKVADADIGFIGDVLQTYIDYAFTVE